MTVPTQGPSAREAMDNLHNGASTTMAANSYAIADSPWASGIPPPATMKSLLSKHVADFDAYWKLVKSYMAGHISKTYFQAQVSKFLPSKEKVALHNFLIISMLHSAYADYMSTQKKAQATSTMIKRTQNLKVMPEYHAFRTRMYFIASQHSIRRISEQAISVANCALHQHIIRSLSALQPDVVKAPLIDDLPPEYDALETTIPGEISAADVDFAIWRRPNILCDNQSIVQHRLSVEKVLY